MSSPEHRNSALQTAQALFMLYVLAIGIKLLCWDGPKGCYRYLCIPPDPNETSLTPWDLAVLCLLYCICLAAMGCFAWLIGLGEVAAIIFLCSWSGVFLWQHFFRDRSNDSSGTSRITLMLQTGKRLGPLVKFVFMRIYPLALLLYTIAKWLKL